VIDAGPDSFGQSGPDVDRRFARKAATIMRSCTQALLGAAILLVATMQLTGCGAPTPSATPAVTAPATGTLSSTSAAEPNGPTTAPTAPIAVDGQRGRPAAGATTPSLPADWPAELPLPDGTLTGATGSNGLWTAQFLMLGSAAGVLQSTADLYRAAGFTAVSDSVLNKGNRQLTLAVENRDHSAGQTTLLIQVSTI
jgi:hypothetical protein